MISKIQYSFVLNPVVNIGCIYIYALLSSIGKRQQPTRMYK